MRNYYFVVPSLPPLSLQDRPEISFEEFVARLEVSLDRKDLEKSRLIRRFVDVCNLRSLFMEEPIDSHGNLNEKELDEALLTRTGLPSFVFEFLDQFEKVPDKIRFFSGVTARFFREAIPKEKGFLQRYFTFERQWRLVLLALRAKQLGRDLNKELQFEDVTDPFVAQILAQKDMESYEPPLEYLELKELVASSFPDPLEEQKLFAKYRFQKIAEIAENQMFSVDQILSYMTQLMLIENLYALEVEKGKRILDTFKTG